MTRPAGTIEMRAAVLSRLGAPLEILDGIECPRPGRGQVLVKIAFSGVCHSQLMETRGQRGEDRFLPHLLGHEATGRVVEVGDGVVKVSPGDAVVLGWIKAGGLDGGPVRYRCRCLEIPINAGRVTTFNEWALVSEDRVVPVPSGVPLDVAVLFGCAVPTGAGIVLHDLEPRPGSTIAVFGLGGIGMSALMATQLFDCARVFAVDVSHDKRELARAFGASDALDPRDGDVVDRIRAATDGAGVDYAVEASGKARVIEQAFDSVRREGGVCVFASHPPQGERISIDPYELICGKQLRGSWGGGSDPDRDLPRFGELYRAGRLPLERLVGQRYRLDDINTALDDLEAGRVHRPLVEIDPALATRVA